VVSKRNKIGKKKRPKMKISRRNVNTKRAENKETPTRKRGIVTKDSSINL
jgi:hypothetical protein